ncbi:MAG: serine/threonine protein kinase, partial [Proteobacteria bacterium]
MSQPSSFDPRLDSSRAPFASRPDFGAVGTMLDGRYRIDHVLGEGGMGVVVRATDTRLDRTVAIKLLHSEYADQEDVLERFAREATVIAKLRSRYVVSVLDVSTDRNRPYLVLEHLEGESLEDRIFREGPLPVGEAVRYSRQVAEALEEAHAAGILHRDIKPANVFLTRQSNHEIIAQILDFGTARFYDAKRDGQLSKPTITKQYETFGSPAYMPPEQISSARNTDERSDIWALGTVLYEAITGRLAFEGEYPEVFVVISTREPPPLRSLRPEAPAELETIIERCLRKVKEDRYASMTELKRALLSLEQEILPARSRPNHTVPSPPMSGALTTSVLGEESVGEFPTTPAPAPGPDLTGDLLRPTPHLPLPVFADVAVRERTPQSIGPRTQPGAPLFDDQETEFEHPAGTERSKRKLAWVGVAVILGALLLFTGIRVSQG